MSDSKTFPEKKGLIRLEAAADYLGISHQYLGKILNDENNNHPLKDYFRHYAGYWRTTYDLLDEYFTNGKITILRTETVENNATQNMPQE